MIVKFFTIQKIKEAQKILITIEMIVIII